MVAFTLPSWWQRRTNQPWCRTAMGGGPSLEGAVEATVRELGNVGDADLALVFASTSYGSDLPRLMPLLRERLKARHWLGCAGGGVIGTSADGTPQEREQEPALSITLLRLPGAEIHPFAIDTTALPDLDAPPAPWIEAVGLDPAAAPSMVLLIDPTCTAINDLINGLDYSYPRTEKIGGVAGQHTASHGSLLLEDGVHGGAIGCVIGGGWRLDPVVAQGCRPIGPVFEVEAAQRNVVLRLTSAGPSGTPVACLQAILADLSPEDRERVRHSLFLGVGRSSFDLPLTPTDPERPESSGQDAFLVRNLIGVDPRTGSLAVAERMRQGQRVQFQLRDGTTSLQEERQLLSTERRRAPDPLAALLFACLGRGRGLYGKPDGDVSLCRELFPELPLSGAFCNGEIGPVSGTTHLHGYTASWGFLVPDRPEASPAT
ncbi:MAG: FIST N-terminal domain-containing protein [Cyanobacteriota bacterium]